ncbi:MAG: T9SS type A sorting domain-containing protein [Bacteroidales bacterium]|nr:T9SS type A sorting domain-containing protein [Bacteroidales bacterium]
MKQYFIFFIHIIFSVCLFSQTILEEDFSDFLPEGWSRANGLLSNVYNGANFSSINYGWYPDTNGYGIAGKHAKTNIFGASIKYWLISPEFSLEQNNDAQLIFSLAATDCDANTPPYTIGQDDKFVVLIFSEDESLSAQNELFRIDSCSNVSFGNIAGRDTLIKLPLNNYSGNLKIAFYAESLKNNSDFDLHVGNIFIGTNPECPPIEFGIEEISSHSVALNLSQAEENIQNIIAEYSTAEDSLWSASLFDTIEDMLIPFQINGLQENTDYKIRLHSRCKYGMNNVAEEKIFSTPCDTVLTREELYICDGGEYDFNSENSYEEGTYYDTVLTENLCPLIREITLIVYKTYDTTIYESATLGEDYIFNSHIINQSGTYSDTLTSVNGCDSVVTLNITFYQGLKEIDGKTEVSIFPNPTTGTLFLEWESENRADKITVYNAMGKKIYEQSLNKNSTKAEIDLKTYKSGNYIIILEDEGKIKAWKKIEKL